MARQVQVRVSSDLYASAVLVSAVTGRSIAGQIVHWARMGRELEASSAVSINEVAELLQRARVYEGLAEAEREAVRAAWIERTRPPSEAVHLRAPRPDGD